MARCVGDHGYEPTPCESLRAHTAKRAPAARLVHAPTRLRHAGRPDAWDDVRERLRHRRAESAPTHRFSA
jgi:hypothetical protein